MAAVSEHSEPLEPSQIIRSVRIYPSIGIARVGNSKDAWFPGPEVPGRFDEPTGGFKDAGAVKRQVCLVILLCTCRLMLSQAARFRVYAFGENDKVLCEANQANGFELHWSLQVANQKPAWYTFMGRFLSHPLVPL